MTISSGSQSQPFLFLLSTSTGYTSVAGSNCTTCSGSPTFEPSGAMVTGGSVEQKLSDNTWATGPVMLGNCSIKERNGSDWTWNDQQILMANESEGIFGSGISGLLGLGTNARNGDYDATPMGMWLKNNPGAPDFSFGLSLNTPSDSVDGGTLHWIKPDENAIQGAISFKDLRTNTNNSSSLDFDSFVLMDSWSFTGPNGVQISKNNEMVDLVTVIDPFFSSVYFPQNETRSIYAGVEGASRELTVSQSTGYSLPCDTKMNLTLAFGNVSVTLDENQLILQPIGDKCLGAIQEWADPSTTEYLLGALYIANIYLIYQGSSSSSSFGFAHRKPAPTQSKVSLVGLIGVALGGAAFLLMVGIIIFLYFQHKKRKAMNTTATIMDPLLPRSSAGNSSVLDLLPRPLTPPSSDWSPQGYIVTSPTSGPRTNRDSKFNRNSSNNVVLQLTSPTTYSHSHSPSDSSRTHQDRPPSTIIVGPSQYLIIPSGSLHGDHGRLSPGWDIRSTSPQPSDSSDSSLPPYTHTDTGSASGANLQVNPSSNSGSALLSPPPGAMVVQPYSVR